MDAPPPAEQEWALVLGLALARQDRGYGAAIQALRGLEAEGTGTGTEAEEIRAGVAARQAQCLAIAQAAVDVALTLGWREPVPMPLRPTRGPNER